MRSINIVFNLTIEIVQSIFLIQVYQWIYITRSSIMKSPIFQGQLTGYNM